MKQDNEQAFSCLIDRYHSVLLRHLLRRTQSTADAQEILQDIFIVMLEKGQGVIYDDTSNQFGERSNEGTYSPVWLSNTLYFRYETLRIISLRLERWYGVKFDITDHQLLQKRYTLEQHNETLENVMKMLSAGDFNYQIKGKTVKIWK